MAMPTTAKLILLTLSAGGAAGVSPPPAQMDQPAYETPAKRWNDLERPSRELRCRERTEQARSVERRPLLDRSPASEHEGNPIYAVDRSIDGCGVLVRMGAPGGALPRPEPATPVVVPARSGEKPAVASKGAAISGQ